jgi:hypothetical protein
LVDDEKIFKPHNLYYVKRSIGVITTVPPAITPKPSATRPGTNMAD